MFTNRHGVNVEAKLNVAFWINIALFCQEVGLNGRELDTIAKQYVGFRMGPFEAMEEVWYLYQSMMHGVVFCVCYICKHTYIYKYTYRPIDWVFLCC